mgnify:CR=1 FL=1
MKTNVAFLCIFISLTLNFKGNHALVGVEVAKVLVEIFSREEETIQDLTEANELIRGLTFDLYDEKVTCDVMGGIPVKD